MYPSARYTLDFRVLPMMIENQPEIIIGSCLYQRERYMAYLFETVLQDFGEGQVRCRPEDFSVTEYELSENDRILYITLPADSSAFSVYCQAYAIFYEKIPGCGIRNARYFSVEASSRNTTCIGTVTAAGDHINYGSSYPTPEENIQKIHRICRG